MGANGCKCVDNCLDDILGSAEHIIVPESQNTIPAIAKPRVANRVGRAIIVLSPIDFNDKAMIEANEVGDVWSDRMLSAKSATSQLAAAQ